MSQQKSPKPDAIPAQQMTDRRPRSEELKKSILAEVNKKVVIFGQLKTDPK